MTRKSKRELERELEKLAPEESADDDFSITIRHNLVDENGDVAGVARRATVGRDEGGEWMTETVTFDLPNDHADRETIHEGRS